MRRQKPNEFSKIRREMLGQLSTVRGAKKNKARMSMALFLLGNGFAYEANGVLKVIKAKTPDTGSSRQYRFLQGATDFLMGRYEEALQNLKHPSMNGNDEGEYWRAAAKVAAGEDIMNSAKFMVTKGSIFSAYPRAIKMKLGMLTTEAAIITGDVRSASEYLGILAEGKPRPKEIDQLALLEGKLKQLAGDFDGAVKAWKAVEKGEHRPSIANAVMLRTNLLLATKKIKEKDVIKELEKLRFAWRGGAFEFDLLRNLGQLYLKVADYPNGLRTLRSAASYFKGNPDASAVTQEMTRAFEKLYLKDAASGMTPLKAIALFEEFKELTPSDEKGDEMIRKLADRLAAVDLLSRAAKLLEEQVGSRLKGVEKTRVGAQLATLYILNREPEKALNALQKTDSKGQLPELTKQRNHLNARALINLNRHNDALILVENDESKDAEILRTEIYWAKDWPKAANSIQKLLAFTGSIPGSKLDDQQAQLVLNFGVALSLSKNNRGLARLSKAYLKEMDATPFKDGFRLIASPDNVGLIDYRTMPGRVKTVNNFLSFMETYRQRLKTGKLSQLN
jgi:hypothetical protein